MEEINKKVCAGQCGRELPATLEYFYKKKNGLYGVGSVCKKCDNIRRKNNLKINKDNGMKTVSTTITKEEYEEALKRSKEINMNMNDYMKLGLLKNNSKYMICVDKTLTDNEAYELSKIGTNINQIAHVCNATGKVYSSDIKALKEMIERCWMLMDKMYNKIDEINEVSLELLKGADK